MPETWPRIQRFGRGFGQDGSTWNCGTLVRSCAFAWFETAMTIVAASNSGILATIEKTWFVPADMVPPLSRFRIPEKLAQTFPAQGIVLASPSPAVRLHPNPRGTEDEPETDQRS